MFAHFKRVNVCESFSLCSKLTTYEMSQEKCYLISIKDFTKENVSCAFLKHKIILHSLTVTHSTNFLITHI